MALDPASYEGLARYHIGTVHLSPLLWKRHAIKRTNLQWKEIQFKKSNAAQIPERRGVYAFLIKNQKSTSRWPMHGYIMYIGIAGKPGTSGNLRKRFGDYFSKAELAARPSIKRLIDTWRSVLYFNFAPVAASTDLMTLERNLAGAIVPPCNAGDLPGDLKKGKKAFF